MNKNDQKELWLFLTIAYAFTWAFWIPEALVAQGVALPKVWKDLLSGPFNLAAWGPLVAVFLLTLIKQGWRGIVGLLKRGVDLRFNKVWLLAVLGLPVLLFGGGILLSILLGGKPFNAEVIANPPYAVVAFVVILLTAGPLQEEFGWRGYALPRLLIRFNGLTAGVIMGVFWWLWHLPAVFIPGKFMTDNLPLFLGLAVVIVFTSVLFTWVYLHTNGSVLAALLLHTAMNWSIWVLMPDMKMNWPTLGLIALLLAIAVALVLRRWGTGLDA